MTNSMQKMFSPRRKHERRWDADAGVGQLWLWMGAFKRWKRRDFQAGQPGLLTYTGRQRKGRRASAGGAINLFEAAFEASATDSRSVVIVPPGGARVHLRTLAAEDRPLLLESLQRSRQAYGAMLARASVLLGTPPARGELMQALQPGGPATAKVTGELAVARELQERMRLRLQELAPFQEAFGQQVAELQGRLRSVADAMDMAGPSGRSSPAPGAPAGQPPQQQQQPRDQPGNGQAGGAGEALDGGGLPQLRQLRRVDSFESALSELQKSPSYHDSASALPGAAAGGPLGAAWAALAQATQDAVRGEALRVVELQAENGALTAAMRSFKRLAQAHARKLRALSPAGGDASAGASFGRSDSSEGDEGESVSGTPSASMDLGFQGGAAAARGGMTPAMSSAYQQAIEALEAVRKHAFEVGAAAPAAAGADEPPPPGLDAEPEGEGDLDELPSDDERSASRSARSLLVESPWVLAARRERLPAPAPVGRGFSIWAVLKNAIGKDLTRITLPATINEPLSALQRMVEDLEYRHLLDRAAAATDAAERTVLVAAFVASGYSATLQRDSKPFNPLLGETFEWQAPDASCRFVCEQVSHHPPISCWWSEGAGWQYSGEIEVRSKFWGRSVEMMPTGTCWLRLGEELWSWSKFNMSINNIILGTIYLDWHGSVRLTNHSTGAHTELHIPKASGKDLGARGAVRCEVADAGGRPAWSLRGRFTEGLTAVPAGGGQPWEVFRVNPPAPHGALQYSLTSLAMTLNAPEPELLRTLPPTDSRFRPDQRALEDGDLVRATPEKLRLEERQREVREQRKARGQPYLPAWFRLREPSEAQLEAGADHWLGSPLVRLPQDGPPGLWQFTGAYWQAKERGDWERCPDIYS